MVKFLSLVVCAFFLCSVLSAEESPLKPADFKIVDAYFLSKENKVMVKVKFGCGCGKNIFGFENFAKSKKDGQEIDLRLLSNNTCMALCEDWQPLDLSKFSALSNNSNLTINAVGVGGKKSPFRFEFKKVKATAE